MGGISWKFKLNLKLRLTCTLQELIYKTLEDYEVYQKQIWSTCTLQAYQKQIINNFLSIKLFGESSNLLCIFYDLLCMFKKNHCISQYRNIIYFNVWWMRLTKLIFNLVNLFLVKFPFDFKVSPKSPKHWRQNGTFHKQCGFFSFIYF